MVELSLTALRVRLVLKWRVGLVESGVGGGVLGRRGAGRVPEGLSEVRMEEKGDWPVMERERVVVLEVRARRARVEMRAVDMAVEKCGWSWDGRDG